MIGRTDSSEYTRHKYNARQRPVSQLAALGEVWYCARFIIWPDFSLENLSLPRYGPNPGDKISIIEGRDFQAAEDGKTTSGSNYASTEDDTSEFESAVDTESEEEPDEDERSSSEEVEAALEKVTVNNDAPPIVEDSDSGFGREGSDIDSEGDVDNEHFGNDFEGDDFEHDIESEDSQSSEDRKTKEVNPMGEKAMPNKKRKHGLSDRTSLPPKRVKGNPAFEKKRESRYEGGDFEAAKDGKTTFGSNYASIEDDNSEFESAVDSESEEGPDEDERSSSEEVEAAPEKVTVNNDAPPIVEDSDSGFGREDSDTDSKGDFEREDPNTDVRFKPNDPSKKRKQGPYSHYNKRFKPNDPLKKRKQAPLYRHRRCKHNLGLCLVEAAPEKVIIGSKPNDPSKKRKQGPYNHYNNFPPSKKFKPSPEGSRGKKRKLGPYPWNSPQDKN